MTTKLRQAMINAMLLRGFSVCTHLSYLEAVADLADYDNRLPALLSTEAIRAYLLYLIRERERTPTSYRLWLNGITFFG